MRITLTAMTPSGEAIGRDGSLVVFTRYGLPGETVDVEITHRRSRFARGRVTGVAAPSPERVQPACLHFGACGGCEWQHAAYAAQLAYKAGIVREQLTRLGGIPDPPVLPCLPSSRAYGYRNHIQLARPAGGRPAYRQPGSHAAVEIERCPIMEPALEALLDCLRRGAAAAVPGVREVHLRAGVATAERMIAFEMERPARDAVAGWVEAARPPADVSVAAGTAARTETIAGRADLGERIGGRVYRFAPLSFFQVNTPVAELLVDQVLQGLALGGAERVLDLYCGAGLFTLPIAARARHTLGIESSAAAVRDARLNLGGLPRAEVIEADVADGLAGRPVAGQAWDRVVLDPPRAGVAGKALARIAGLDAPRLVYVSCDPATLARDARLLGGAGYRLERAQPLDMFPHTHHVETVAVFSRQRL